MHSQWRHSRYWNEEIDNLFKSHKSLFETLFATFSNRHKTPADRSDFCKVDEFETLWNACGLIEDNFVQRDVAICFNLSMMTQVDELNSEKFMRMTYIEWLEAIARAADIISLSPYE